MNFIQLTKIIKQIYYVNYIKKKKLEKVSGEIRT